MHVGHVSSSESKPCAVCGKKTAHYKVYEQSGISVKIPLCDSMDDLPTCYSSVDVKSMTSGFLTSLKKVIKGLPQAIKATRVEGKPKSNE
jgi:hypothetical protein